MLCKIPHIESNIFFVISSIILLIFSSLFAKDPNRIDQLLKKNGVVDQVAKYPSLMKKGVELQSKGINKKTQNNITTILKASYKPEDILKTIKKELLDHYNSHHLNKIEKFYESDLAKYFTDLEVKGSSPDVMDKIKTLQEDSIPKDKIAAIDKLAQAANVYNNSLEVSKMTYSGMFYTLNYTLPIEKQKNFQELQVLIDKMVEKSKPAIIEMVRKNLLVVYESAKTEHIKKYTQFYLSPAGKWMQSYIQAGKMKALIQGSKTAGGKIGKLKTTVSKKKK